MMKQPFKTKRRQILALFCSTVALSQWPLVSLANSNEVELLEWRGIALGADAQLKIYHEDKHEARHLLQAILKEVQRQERLFSLYRDDSVISHLNNEGEVSGFSHDFYWLMSLADEHVRLTHGVFDPTVQILWETYRDYLIENPQASPEELKARMTEVRHLLGWDGIQLTPNRIRLAKPGQRITLNGIAQGFITDRVTDLMQQRGVDHALINMGEIRGLLPLGKAPWSLGIADPLDASQILKTLELGNQAMATSSSRGTYLSYEKSINHIFDPATSQSDERYLSVTVIAPTATQADALATAFSIMPIESIKNTLKQISKVSVWILGRDRQWIELS
ncbi:FAD:protein FMN transferase [Oligella urethralis]|uniref:FAD:protein FMN transferase n=1 Tax=Oligella urethralis TaxID=90245 RepID=A0A2X1VFL0_9BURK|nr:FAD:protein FMN transferase [Oligella urethralis]SPY07140.1 Thiamine biosynthesis lipoprotein ApbE precursor [Oligella urethralis]